MTTQIKIYVALAAAALVIAAAIIGSSLWSDHRIAKLERESQLNGEHAAAAEQKANELEQAASEYKAKIDYLENQLDHVRAEAQKQDEKLQQTHIDTYNARGRVAAARGVRTSPTTADELCRKLAEVDHPC